MISGSKEEKNIDEVENNSINSSNEQMEKENLEIKNSNTNEIQKNIKDISFGLSYGL